MTSDLGFIPNSAQGNSDKLSSEIAVSITPLTKRATKRVVYGVYEPFFAPIEDLEADKDGDGLSSKQIQKVTAQGRVFLYDDQVHWLNFQNIQVGHDAIAIQSLIGDSKSLRMKKC